MTFNTEVVRLDWNDEAEVQLRQTNAAGETRDFDKECDLVFYATGVLNNFK
jgi:cation diffusion facilitator CzcD-associated flavoprotein CzcO